MSTEPYVPSEAMENITEAMERAGHGDKFMRAQIAKIKADALREAAEGFRHCKDYGYRATRMRATEDYLNDRADRIEEEA